MAPLPQLPPEIILRILAMSIEAECRCAFSLFVPDWGLCPKRKQGVLEVTLRTTRFDTYTALGDGRGLVSTAFGHTAQDCIDLPDPRDPPFLGPSFDREVFKHWWSCGAMVFRQTIPDVQLETAEGKTSEGALTLRESAAIEILPYLDPLGGRLPKARIPSVCHPYKSSQPEAQSQQYIYQRFRHLILNTDPRLKDDLLPNYQIMSRMAARNGRGVRELVAAKLLDFERYAHLLVDWRAMSRLESLFLDARGHSLKTISKGEIEGVAKALAGKDLKLLVIAGLRSFELYPGPEEMEVEEETPGGAAHFLVSSNADGKGWIDMFRHAVRPGGKLILVDKQADYIEPLRFWRPDQP